MSEINDGGPAFPGERTLAEKGMRYRVQSPGMSLRDWFAGQALAGWVAAPNTTGSSEVAARQCYAYADAMLKAREEQPK